MNDSYFTQGNSIIHRTDPRHRVVIAVLFSFVVAMCQLYPAILLAVVSALALTVFARLNVRQLLRRFTVVLLFLMLIWLVLPLTVVGKPILTIGPISLSQSGVALAGKISLKMMTILTVFTVLLATIPLSTLGHALISLKVSKKIVYLILMTYRYISLLEDEYRRSLRAVRVRGFIPRTNLHTYKTYAFLIGMLLVRSLARAERIEWAMRCRGFQGTFHSLAVFKVTNTSWVFSLLMTLAIGSIAFLEWGRISPLMFNI